MGREALREERDSQTTPQAGGRVELAGPGQELTFHVVASGTFDSKKFEENVANLSFLFPIALAFVATTSH